jgi:hypothetical protein
MFNVTCLVDPRRTVGTPRKLGLEGPRMTVPAQRYLLVPHQSSGGAVEAGRLWCRTGRWRRSVRTLLRRGQRGKEAGEGVVLLVGGARLL